MIVIVKDDKVINGKEMLSLDGVWTTKRKEGVEFHIDSWFYDHLKIACDVGINPGQALRKKYIRVGILNRILLVNGSRIHRGQYRRRAIRNPEDAEKFTVDRKDLKVWLAEAADKGLNEADYIKEKLCVA